MNEAGFFVELGFGRSVTGDGRFLSSLRFEIKPKAGRTVLTPHHDLFNK